MRYWQRRPYLGLGLDASSMLREALHAADSPRSGRVLRSTTTSDLKAFFERPELAETVWLSPAQQHEEAWFLGLRLNEGVNIAAVEREFGREPVAHALDAVQKLADAGLVTADGEIVRLTPQGQLLSNNVFQEFLDLGTEVDLGIS
jgi:oxygen-independent coproporphyrinogen-3 oxidase